MFKTIKQAFANFIETCKAQTEASRELTEATDRNTAALCEQTKALQEHSAALLTKGSTIDSIEAHAKFLANAQRRDLERRGHTS
jgi:hypothetical protein